MNGPLLVIALERELDMAVDTGTVGNDSAITYKVFTLSQPETRVEGNRPICVARLPLR
jgi:hypothetical protein